MIVPVRNEDPGIAAALSPFVAPPESELLIADGSEGSSTSKALAAVGARIVAETFHRAMEGSQSSIVRDPTWRPSLGPDNKTFRMGDLLLFAFEGKKRLLNPLGN